MPKIDSKQDNQDIEDPILCRINSLSNNKQYPESIAETDWVLDGQNRTNRRRKISQTALKSIKSSASIAWPK